MNHGFPFEPSLRDVLLPKLLLGELRVPIGVQLKEACA